MTPNARTLNWAKGQGYLVAIVEKWVPFPRPHGKRHDLWGFVDVLAIKDGLCHLWQVTTMAHMANRIDKIKQHPNYKSVKESRAVIQVIGWAKRGARGKRKTWQPTFETL